MKLKDQINSYLQKVIENITEEKAEIEIQSAQESIHGDYSTNAALKIFRKAKDRFKNPLELAKKIAGELEKISELSSILEKAEVAAPGFINFWLKDTALLENLEEVIDKKENYGKRERFKSKKIMLEFAHPNTHKLFHIGHLRNIIIGESLARLLEFQASKVIRANYQGDVGLHVAKAVYGLQTTDYSLEEIGKKSVDEKMRLLAKAYVKGNEDYENNPKAKAEIAEINKNLYGKDQSIMDLWKKTRDWSLEYFDRIYKRAGTKFDKLYFESEVADFGKEIVMKNLNNVFIKDQGAIIFAGEKYGLHNRVFINSLGLPTYEAKDVGLAYFQMKDFSPNKIIHVVGPEQKRYFEVLFKALEAISNMFKNREIHLEYGFVRLKEGRMSSRKGDVVEGEWLLDEAKARLRKEFNEMDEETLEKVAVGAVKYSMLKFSRTSDILFSFEESISFEGNSGPYIQYTFARTQSVLAKVKTQNSKVKIERQKSKLEAEELSVLRLLVHFSEIVEEAGENFAPNLLCNYLFELSQKFNNFYQKHKILGSDKEEFRLQLTFAAGQILKTGLYLLGIEAPSKM